jgi:flagellar protein FlgJ
MYMRWNIKGAVGVGQPNYHDDVIKVQMLLNRAANEHHQQHLKEDGIFGPQTKARIAEFQKECLHFKHTDAIVNRQGPTLQGLKHSSGLHGSSSHVSTAGSAAQTIVPNSAAAHLLLKQATAKPGGKKLAWIKRALPAAINVKARWGVPIAVTLAQGALESSWGTNAPGNIYFGVKGNAKTGKTLAVATHEDYGKGLVAIKDNFRAYDTLEQSADDYGQFLAHNKRYRGAFAFRNDPEKFIHMVVLAGYATDKDYESKILSIIRFNGFKDYDQAH